MVLSGNDGLKAETGRFDRPELDAPLEAVKAQAERIADKLGARAAGTAADLGGKR